jgi:hypothetical protein
MARSFNTEQNMSSEKTTKDKSNLPFNESFYDEINEGSIELTNSIMEVVGKMDVEKAAEINGLAQDYMLAAGCLVAIDLLTALGELRRLSKSIDNLRHENDLLKKRGASLESCLRENSEDLASLIEARYSCSKDYPGQNRRYMRDMDPVFKARTMLGPIRTGAVTPDSATPKVD